MKYAIENETKCLMYALSLANSEYKPQIQHILNQLYQFKIDSTMTLNSKSNSNANENASQKINVDSEMKNTQVEQNNQKSKQS